MTMSFKLYDDLLGKLNDEDKTCICPHHSIVNENGIQLCLDCGEEIKKDITHEKEWRYYGISDSKSSDPNRAHARKNEEKNILKDVQGLHLSQNVIHKANELYVRSTKGQIYRGGSRKAIIFACVYHAYKLLGEVKTPDSLIQLFGLTRKEGLKGLKIVNVNNSKGSEIHETCITSKHIISDILSKFSMLDEQKKDVYKIYERIKNKSSKLNRARPQSVASAVIYYWIITNNININIKDFAEITKLSELTITKNTREVQNIIN
jgi:transcription initiation factor TFIIIB Brf1 subunit/transcription initiation factor TFIIB